MTVGAGEQERAGPEPGPGGGSVAMGSTKGEPDKAEGWEG